VASLTYLCRGLKYFNDSAFGRIFFRRPIHSHSIDHFSYPTSPRLIRLLSSKAKSLTQKTFLSALALHLVLTVFLGSRERQQVVPRNGGGFRANTLSTFEQLQAFMAPRGDIIETERQEREADTKASHGRTMGAMRALFIAIQPAYAPPLGC
jgi:hypothetical protein